MQLELYFLSEVSYRCNPREDYEKEELSQLRVWVLLF